MIKYVVKTNGTTDWKYLSQEERMIYRPSKYFSGDCFYPMFYKAKWFDSAKDAEAFMRFIPRERNYWGKTSNWIIVPLDIEWVEIIKDDVKTGKFYPSWKELEPVLEF